MEKGNQRWGKVITLELAGDLDKRSAQQVRQAIFQAIDNHPAQIVINMGKVDSLDSSGLSALVAGLNYAQKNNVRLYLCNLQAPVRMIFELTRLDKVFDIFVNEEDALQDIVE